VANGVDQDYNEKLRDIGNQIQMRLQWISRAQKIHFSPCPVWSLGTAVVAWSWLSIGRANHDLQKQGGPVLENSHCPLILSKFFL
jgi:hypothetical protein